MNQLADALEKEGFKPEDVTLLRSSGKLKDILDVLHGLAEIKPVEHLIDCDEAPFCPPEWEVVEHRKCGRLQWSKDLVKLWLSESQKSGTISGHELRKELEGKPVLPANVLDFLLAHPELIPEEWKGKYIYFWGTIYRDSSDSLYVFCLYWDGRSWNWSYNWLDNDWNSDRPVALAASIS